MIRRLITLVLMFVLLLPVWSFAADQETVRDLAKAYETWTGKGIKFVIREDGKFKTWGVGRLESWNHDSTWVVRDPKGRFLTKASGRVENWSNGKSRLVLRTPKGQMMTHISIDITSKACFAKNVIGLRRLDPGSKFLAFAQETLSELLVKDLKANDRIRTRVLLQYINKYKSQPGAANFKPVLKAALQQLNFMATQNGDEATKKLAAEARELLSQI